MEQKDLVIGGATDKINKELERLEKELKPSAYVPKTNCRFGYNDKLMTGEGINIRTINDNSDLVKILSYIKRKQEDYANTVTILVTTVPGITELPSFTWNGFSMTEWFDDIVFFIKKIAYNQKVKELNEYKKTLEPLYSQDKKDQITIDSILNKLNF